MIPTSAHGTNPATAVICGLDVVPVDCDEKGNIDVADFKAKVALYNHQIAATMITYPSTFGVFESTVADLCSLIHSVGGLVYMDGANLNA